MNLHETCQEKRKSNLQLSASPVHKEGPFFYPTSITLGNNYFFDLSLSDEKMPQVFYSFPLSVSSSNFEYFVFHQQLNGKHVLPLSL